MESRPGGFVQYPHRKNWIRLAEEDPNVETWDAIRARRNVRAYRPDPVAASDLDRITEAGRRAPSASN